jgi:hypothetical protein
VELGFAPDSHGRGHWFDPSIAHVWPDLRKRGQAVTVCGPWFSTRWGTCGAAGAKRGDIRPGVLTRAHLRPDTQTMPVYADSTPIAGLLLIVGAIWVVVGALVGYLIGKSKGRGTAGLWLGLLLGPIGWLCAALMGDSERFARRCPFCAEAVQPAAVVCRYCGHDIPLTAPAVAGR